MIELSDLIGCKRTCKNEEEKFIWQTFEKEYFYAVTEWYATQKKVHVCTWHLIYA